MKNVFGISCNRFVIGLLLILVSSCVYESDDPVPTLDGVFVTYTSEMKPDSILNSKSEYIVVIGDIQEYITPIEFGVDSYSYYLNTMAWIYRQHKAFANIECVLLTGDMTWENRSYQWESYKVGASFFEDTLPLLICTGNHDYDWSKSEDGRLVVDDRSSSLINSFFPGKALMSHVKYWFEDGKWENYIARFNWGGEDFNILVLEFAPRKEVVDWAIDIVNKNANEKYILMTHEMLNRNYIMDLDSSSKSQFAGTKSTYSTPKEIWDKLVYPNDNILFTLCGHNQHFSHVKMKNIKGREVSNIMYNLQYEKNGGDGKIMIWEFMKNENAINVFEYNTVMRCVEKDKIESFKVECN